MYRPVFLILVASIVLISCNNLKNKSEKNDNSWEKVYEKAWKNHDYPTAIVALNQLILTDTANENHYDSLATYYLKQTQNFYSGKIMVDKGLLLNPKNFQLLEYRAQLMIGEGTLAGARTVLEKAFSISRKNKYRYMIAATYANENNVAEFEKIIDEMLTTDLPSEKLEAPGENNSIQLVELKATCYMGKARISPDPVTMERYLDSALRIQPDYQEALYYLDKLKTKGAK